LKKLDLLVFISDHLIASLNRILIQHCQRLSALGSVRYPVYHFILVKWVPSISLYMFIPH